MGDAYLHRVVRDKPDVDSVLEKEEPIGVGIEFISNPVIATSSENPPGVMFYYNWSEDRLTVRPYLGSTVLLVADGFNNTQGMRALAVDRTNKVAFFSLGNFESSPWTSYGLYSFTYDPDTGVPVGGINLIHTASGSIVGLMVDEVNQKLYRDSGSGGLIRSDYDISNPETVASSGSHYGMYLDTPNDLLYVSMNETIVTYDLSSLPASSVLWFKEDSPGFGGSTWYKWRDLAVDLDLGIMITSLSDQITTRYIDFPVPPATPTSWPPAYSVELTRWTSGALGLTWVYDEVDGYLYLHDGNSAVTNRYSIANLLMEEETLIENLSTFAADNPSTPWGFNHINKLRLG